MQHGFLKLDYIKSVGSQLGRKVHHHLCLLLSSDREERVCSRIFQGGHLSYHIRELFSQNVTPSYRNNNNKTLAK